jgi:hypothetical protein
MTKRFLAALVLCLVALPSYAGFSEVARTLDSRKGVRRQWIPFLGLARVAVRVVAPEGVHDFQLAVFEGAETVGPQALQDIMRKHAGPGFQPLVQVWSRKSQEWTFIYARPTANGERIELILLAHDDDGHGETVLVRVDVDAHKLARELEVSPRNVSHVAGR